MTSAVDLPTSCMTSNSVSSMCTTFCGDTFKRRSCSKTILVDVYHTNFPESTVRMYAFSTIKAIVLSRVTWNIWYYDRYLWIYQIPSYLLFRDAVTPLLMCSECVSLSVNFYRKSEGVRIRSHETSSSAQRDVPEFLSFSHRKWMLLD